MVDIIGGSASAADAFPFLDADFISYAGAGILARSLAVALVALMALHVIDMSSDSSKRPSARVVALRALAAVTVPLVLLTSSAWAGGTPSQWRTHGDGTYVAGTDLPAGYWALTARGLASARITPGGTTDGAEAAVTAEWGSGTMRVELRPGDVLEVSGAVVRDCTAGVAYSPDAPTQAESPGVAMLVGGCDIMPGTYEVEPLGPGDGSPCEVQLRGGFLSATEPLLPAALDGVTYIDVHTGDVLYVRAARIGLYSRSFQLGARDGDDAAGGQPQAEAQDVAQDVAQDDAQDVAQPDTQGVAQDAAQADAQDEAQADAQADEGLIRRLAPRAAKG